MSRQQNMPALLDDELCPRKKRLTINYFLWSGMVYKPILPSTILNNRWVKISLWSSDKFTSYLPLCYKDYSYLCWYIYMAAAFPWLKYCRHGVKLKSINQSISILSLGNKIFICFTWFIYLFKYKPKRHRFRLLKAWQKPNYPLTFSLPGFLKISLNV